MKKKKYEFLQIKSFYYQSIVDISSFHVFYTNILVRLAIGGAVGAVVGSSTIRRRGLLRLSTNSFGVSR